jgi:hypothetical protein
MALTKEEFDQVLVTEEGFSQDLADEMWAIAPPDSPLLSSGIEKLRAYVVETRDEIRGFEAQLAYIRRLEVGDNGLN